MKTAILGAGVSGLALARHMIEGGADAATLCLFEAAPEPGGLCRSKTVDGFTYDVAGGHILFSKDAETMRWMKACAGGEDAFVRRDRNTRIRYDDRWVRYPFENGLGDLPPQANYACIKGYVEAWHQREMDGSCAPADFAGWIRWRFGDGIAEHFMDPYNLKIWKRPLAELTSGWVAGRVPDAPPDDVLKAAVGLRTEGYVHQAIFYYPKRGGFQAITDGLASTLGPQLRLSTPVAEVKRRGERWSVNGEEFDRVVSTLPLNVLPDVVADMPSDVADAMRGLAYNSITCILLALDRAEHPDLSWIYLPFPSQGPANRVTYMSNYSPGNAPEGKTSLMCEVTHTGGADGGSSVVDEALAGVIHAGLMTKDELLFADATRSEFAYIVYDHGFDAKKSAALAWLGEAGIVPLGRFGRYEYDNSDQCVIKARALSEELLRQAVRG